MTKVINKKKKVKVTTKVQDVGTKMEYCEIYVCLRRLMRFTRWFGLFPLEGLNSTTISGLKFNVKCFYGFYLAFTVLGQFSMAIISFWGLISSQFALNMLSHTIFYTSSFVSSLLLMVLAKSWPILMKEVAEIEREVDLKWDKKTALFIFRINLFLLVSSIVEHFLCYVYVTNFTMKCLQEFSLSYDVIVMVLTLKLQFFLQTGRPNTHQFLTGALFEITNAQAKFSWALIDMLVVSHSVYLGAYFKALNKLIESEKFNKSAIWGQLRLRHARLVTLMKKINGHISAFVLISFSTNLFYTVVQLFKSLRYSRYEFGFCDLKGALEAISGFIHGLYYVYSFVCLVVRTLIVSILTANVHTHAFQPITVLGEIHASMYDREIQRFYRQITYTTVGVNGIFFYVTRGMILKVLGTLITYELVLLQFTHVSESDNSTSLLLYNSSMANTTTHGRTSKFTFDF